jgi:hypothetical protein
MPLLHRQMLDVLGVKNAQKLIPMPEDMKPRDPVTENQNILMSKPVKAFAYQDHQAHITVHMSAMQDPKIMALLQNNPMAQSLQAAMMAHINEHLGFQYRVEIENQLGFNLPAQVDASGEDTHIDPETEARLAPMLSMAAQKLLMQSQQQAQQAQAQQMQQDPMIQMQQAELQIKAAEQQRKVQKDQSDVELKNKQIQVDAIKAAAEIATRDKSTSAARNLDALKTIAQMATEKENTKKRNALEILKHEDAMSQKKEPPKQGE